MNFKRIYPKTHTVKSDILAAEGCTFIGCKKKGDKLVPALGVGKGLVGEAQNIPLNMKFAQYSPLNDVYAACANNYFYMALDGLDFSVRKKFPSTDFMPSLLELSRINTSNSVVIGDTYSILFNKLGNLTSVYKGGIHSVILKNGRVFGIDNETHYKIKWSGEASYEDWTENISGAGWTILGYGHGEILNLVLFNDTVVAVREYGLTLFSAYGTPENYKLSYIDGTTPKICPNTARVVGRNLVFYTEDGLYYYDGSSIRKAVLPHCEDIYEPVNSAFLNNKYFLCGRSKALGRCAVFVADIVEGSGYLVDQEAEAIAAGPNIFAYCSGVAYPLIEGEEYTFINSETDFSTTRTKVLKEIVLNAEAKTEIEVSNGVNLRILRGIRGKLRVNMRGDKFVITLKSKGEIKSVYAIAEVLDGV